MPIATTHIYIYIYRLMRDDPERVGELQRARMAVDSGGSERVVHTYRDRLDRLARISRTAAQRSMVSAFRSVSRHESIGMCLCIGIRS